VKFQATRRGSIGRFTADLTWYLTYALKDSVEQTMLSVGYLLYGAMVIALGTTVYATQRITFQAINLAFMPGFGFATAATTLTGQSLGAGRQKIKK